MCVGNGSFAKNVKGKNAGNLRYFAENEEWRE
jgi:hypothetical protein